MTGRIVLFGATGYTGELVARSLVASGQRPVLAARSAVRLEALADALGGLDTAVADVDRPASVRALVEGGDVLVSTVGPFVRWGAPALEAALDAGAHYLDSTGEPTFVRDVFERHGPRARAAGSALLTAFGYDWVPGNLAGALALHEAGPDGTRVAVGYLARGRAGKSGGTQASLTGAALAPSHTYRDGQLKTERSAARARRFRAGDHEQWLASVGASEHFTLPALHPTLREVDVLLTVADTATTRALPALTLGLAAVTRLPLVRPALTALMDRREVPTGGPDAEARARSGCTVLAEVRSSAGALLSEVRLDGPNPYTFTGDVMAWGATQLAEGAVRDVGALGPVAAFGLTELEQGAAGAGLARTPRDVPARPAP